MSKSVLELSREQLENIKKYRYATNGLTTLEIYIFDPFWNFIANNLYPDWLAPNLITLLGLIFPLMALISTEYLNPSMDGDVPKWQILLYVFANFWYMTLDATDGKQARRTNNCSPLG